MSAMTFARQTEVQAWEQEITPCEHTLCLEQSLAKQLESHSALFSLYDFMSSISTNNNYL